MTREVDVHDPESGEPMDADTIPVEDDIHVRGDDTAEPPKRHRRPKVTKTFPKPVFEILLEFIASESNRAQFPIMVLFIVLYLVIAVASSDAERAFSLMKLIKTVFRNRMGNRVLQQIMTLCMNGPKDMVVGTDPEHPTEFDEVIDLALTLWAAGPTKRDAPVTPARRTRDNMEWAAKLNERAKQYGTAITRADMLEADASHKQLSKVVGSDEVQSRISTGEAAPRAHAAPRVRSAEAAGLSLDPTAEEEAAAVARLTTAPDRTLSKFYATIQAGLQPRRIRPPDYLTENMAEGQFVDKYQ